MSRPQRHRLLHGYPMLPLMPKANGAVDGCIDPSRPLLVGVLPHPFCNPRVAGCGFCTFPHEPFRHGCAAATTRAVLDEIDAHLAAQPRLRGKPVVGLYFGGGTANLTPAAEFRQLCQTLQRQFDLRRAEVTLEGVPRCFLAGEGALISAMRDELDARHFRLSLGVQTFDRTQLERMGRQAFGDREAIARVVKRAHGLGMTTSADLLVNLPSQSAQQVIADLDQAIAVGFDQICVYHLVLYDGLGTAWSHDPSILSALPAASTALQTWRTARRFLLQKGFAQATLTNFERADVARSERRFSYERCSFHPDVYDAVGFGPGAISTFLSANMDAGKKLVNCVGSAAYRQRIRSSRAAVDRSFDYTSEDLQLLFITRSLPLLHVSRPSFRHYFGADIVERYPDIVDALCRRRLLEVAQDALRLTERGMFFADSVAGLFACRRAPQLRRRVHTPLTTDAAAAHMG